MAVQPVAVGHACSSANDYVAVFLDLQQVEAGKHACSFANDSDAVAQDLHRECSAKGVPRKELSRYCPELEDQLCEMVFDQSFD